MVWELAKSQLTPIKMVKSLPCWTIGFAGSVARDMPESINLLRPGPSNGGSFLAGDVVLDWLDSQCPVCIDPQTYLARSMSARPHDVQIDLLRRPIRILDLTPRKEDVTLGEHPISARPLELRDLLRRER